MPALTVATCQFPVSADAGANVACRLRRNRPGVLITVVDTDAETCDSTRAWRGRALAGQLHSGTLPAGPARGAVGTPPAQGR